MREKFQRFMMGRYGVDDFSKFLLYVVLALCILTFFTKSSILNFLVLVGICYTYFRIFSKNHSKRWHENLVYIRKRDQVKHFFRRQKNLAEQRKIYRIYSCPNCQQKIRIPKGHGKVQVTCPKCRMEFIRRS